MCIRKNLREFIEVFGYRNEEEFIKEAVEDKILSLISERDVLKAFRD